MAKKPTLKDSINASFSELDQILQRHKELLLARCSQIDQRIILNFTLDMSNVVNNCGRLEPEELHIPGARGIAEARNGDIFITSCTANCVYVYSQAAQHQIRIIHGTTTGEGNVVVPFNKPHGIDISDDIVYVAEFGGNRIRAFTTQGVLKCTFGNPLEGQEDKQLGELKFLCPHDVKIGPDERVYVVDRGNDCIQVFRKNGGSSDENSPVKLLSMEISYPEGIAFHGPSFHVTGYGSSRFIILNENMIQQYISPKMENIMPKGIAVDNASGYTLITVVISRGNLNEHGALQVYNRDKQLVKTITAPTITHSFKNPFGILITDHGKSVWVADREADKVFKLNRTCVFN